MTTLLPLYYRLTGALLVPLQLFATPLPVLDLVIGNSAAKSGKAPFGQVFNLGKTAPRDPEPFVYKLSFSTNPTDLEIEMARVFEEPLLPQGTKRDPAENKALAAALISFSNRIEITDTSVLTQFIQQYPHSRWLASLDLNLGLLNFQYGYLTQALANWQEAWTLTQNETEHRLHALADRAFGELVNLEAKLGKTDDLTTQFAATSKRAFFGPGSQKVKEARQGYHVMQTHTSVAFKCGPFALDSVRTAGEKRHKRSALIEGAASTKKGTSLAMVKAWADQLKLNYQMAKRSAGAALLVPSVMHWKLGHFAAITQYKHGRYLIQDPTFGGSELWVTAQALEKETSGYFLVPEGPLPSGWTAVSKQEASTVWGRGGAKTQDTNSTKKDDNKTDCPTSAPMTQPTAFAMLATLHMQDTPLRYSVPVGPQPDFTIGYNENEANQTANSLLSNFSASWVFEYFSYLTVNASNQVIIRLPGGGAEVYNYSAFDDVNNVYAPDLESQAQLYIIGAGNYERRLPDGSKLIYNQMANVAGGVILLKQMVDPQGNSLILNYDSTFRLSSLVDQIGQSTTFSYVSNTTGNSGYYLINKITDPFGRFCTFTYDSNNVFLMTITDCLGIQSQFTYDTTNNLVDTLVTPYGKTTFYRYIPSENNDPSGASGLKITWPDGTSSITENYKSHELNTYYWDRRSSPAYPDTAQARITHWLQESADNVESSVIQYTKEPLEAQVTYTYADGYSSTPGPTDGQGHPTPPDDLFTHYYLGTSNQPITISRVLDNGDTQSYQYSYNSLGNVTQSEDPLGRITAYTYDANNIDVVKVQNTTNGATDLLAYITYNSQHLPLTVEDGSAQVTTYTYNSLGQVLTVKNAKNQTTTFTYDPVSHYLTSVYGPLGTSSAWNLTYHNGQIQTITDSEGYTKTFTFDNYDRLISVTYPDGTSESTQYVNLDPVFSKDRLGNTTQRQFNSLRQLVAETDANGHTTKYSWCTCGALGSLTDGNGNLTTWTRDVQGRVTSKVFADTSKLTYTYETSTSRLKSVQDALNQTKNYTYNDDNTLQNVTYGSPVNPTSTVSYLYDPNYTRLTSASNGWGTTRYTYYPHLTSPTAAPVTGAGQLKTVSDSALANSTVTYTYDELGRATNRQINGAANSSTVTFDAMGRVSSQVNPLGTFGYTYVDQNAPGGDKGTSRLSQLTYPNGQVTNYGWYATANDERLQQISNLNPSSAVLSQFNYSYDARGDLLTDQRQFDSNSPTTYTYGYDPVGQLTSAVLSSGAQNYYNYDAAGNRISEQRGSGVLQTTVNNLSQITQIAGGGATRFQGTINLPGTVQVNGQSASMSTSTNFVANPVLPVGTNSVSVVAQSGKGITTNTYSVVIPGATTVLPTYDKDGNLLNNGSGQTYTWDAENRLLSITYTGGSATTFSYNAEGKRVKIVEMNAAHSIVSTKQFIWCGNQICEERDSANNVTKRFYGLGEQISGTSYYYTRDQLGSVREMTNSAGTIQVRYDYDPYGRVTPVGTVLVASDFQYAGYYTHAASGLNLTKYRAYDPNTAKWLSRDPIAENGGINLYGYVLCNPIDGIDTLGLDRWSTDMGHTSTTVQDQTSPTGYSQIEFGPDITNPYTFFLLALDRGTITLGKVFITPVPKPQEGFFTRCIPSTESQDKALVDWATQVSANPPPYNTAFYNCRNFSAVAESVGLDDNTLSQADLHPDVAPFVPIVAPVLPIYKW